MTIVEQVRALQEERSRLGTRMAEIDAELKAACTVLNVPMTLAGTPKVGTASKPATMTGKVLAAVANSNGPIRAVDVATAVGASGTDIGTYLSRLTRVGKIVKIKWGLYEIAAR